MSLSVAFLWHMHQPDYVDPARKAALMPWVRLHATKGYLDMIWQVEQHPEFRCTFNLTPVLIKQIRQLVAGEVRDLWLELAATPANDLTGPQQAGILEHFFKANWANMVRPHSRYWSLLQKRGTHAPVADLERIAGRFTAQDYRDLQVWFNLAWFGYAAGEIYPQLGELKQKGQGFTEEDKQVVLDCQREVLRSVLDRYQAAARRGQVELSTTPFYHPILPLIFDTDFARRCMPGRVFPPRFAHPDDARAHLVSALAQHAEVFGTPARGIWPAEGSVCPEMVPVLQELGIEWFATDEEVLWRSLRTSVPDRNELYQGYRAEFACASAGIAFRERSLSDFVGFTAARNEPDRAADYLIGHLEQISRHAGNDGALCAIILDGENAWENFPDGGRAFLDALYQRLSNHAELQPTVFQSHFQAHPPQRTLPALHTGSWINADFDIWICDPEENRAWELLGRTRDFLQRKINRGEITGGQYRQALDEIYAAEGSDWFWWYGSDFVTENDLLFDELFRAHLQGVYRICGVPVPDELQTRICRSEVAPEFTPMTGLISPQIDGEITSYYEWSGAGMYEAGKATSAMYQAERVVDRIHFGADLHHFYLRLDFSDIPSALNNETELRIAIVEPRPTTLTITQLNRPDGRNGVGVALDGSGSTTAGESVQVAVGRILELAVPLATLGWLPGDDAEFFVQVSHGNVALEQHPDAGLISFRVPDDQFLAENWTM
jgi:alpha-amylase/alpha-mannosidase (GH57 family)